MRTLPRLCEVHPGICLTTEEKVRKTLSQDSRRMPVGPMETEYTEHSIQTISRNQMQSAPRYPDLYTVELPEFIYKAFLPIFP